VCYVWDLEQIEGDERDGGRENEEGKHPKDVLR